MTLRIYCSFEPASLGPFIDHWRHQVDLTGDVALHGPAELAWGLTSAQGADEQRVFVLDAAGVEQMVAGGVAPVCAAHAAGAVPIVALLPDPSGHLDRSRLEGVRASLLDMAAAFRDAGVSVIHDAESNAIAGVPFTDQALAVVATALIRETYRRVTVAPKVIAVDADGTLWQGLCAEAGPAGVELTDDDLWLQRWLVAQQRGGVLLALVSKNVTDDVAAVFRERTEMPLQSSDFVVVRAGWQSKAVVLREIARELNLALDAFAFIDDSPAECAEVRALCPEVAVVQRPVTQVADVIGSTWCFDRRDGAVDRVAIDSTLGAARTKLYQDEAIRRAAANAAPSYADHIASLGVRTTMRAAGLSDQARVFELAQRTNQFNTCADRPTSDTVRSAIEHGGVQVVEVVDRFGDYGLCGAVFGELAADRFEVSRVFLSCRVLGRGVEADVIDALVAHARAAGVATLRVHLATTARNLPALRFFDALGASGGAADAGKVGDARTLVFPLDALSPCPRNELRDAGESPAVRGKEQRQSRDWMSIGEATRSLSALMRAVGFAAAPSLGGLAPQDDGQAVIQVVSDVLGVQVSRDANLYALGADSLRIVRILARLKSRLGLDLPIGDVMHCADMPTLIAMARRATVTSPVGDDGYFDQVQSLYETDDMRR